MKHKYEDFDYGIIKSCLARPDLYDVVRVALDEIYDSWPVYKAMKDCVGMSGKAFEYKHDIFYNVLSGRVDNPEDTIDFINAQVVPHETLINRVKTLKNKHLNKKIASEVSDLYSCIISDSTSLDEKWDRLKLFCVSSMSSVSNVDNIDNVSDFADKIIDNIRCRQNGITTGYFRLDKLLNGFSRTNFSIIAGAPSMGKTSFAINCAVGAAIQGHSVLFCTIEMDTQEILERILALLSKVSIPSIRNGKLTAAESGRLNGAVETLRRLDIKIVHRGSLRPSDVSNLIQTSYSGKTPSIVFVDYIQLMNDDSGARDEYQITTNVSKSLKQVAMNTGVPIVAVAQLSRKVTESGRSHRPKMSDLKGSGSLEQDANKIILIHREDYFRRAEGSTQQDGLATIIVDKNRQGPCGDVEFIWIPEFFLFTEIPDEYKEKPKTEENAELF